jgi:hypothetical protein
MSKLAWFLNLDHVFGPSYFWRSVCHESNQAFVSSLLPEPRGGVASFQDPVALRQN